MWIPNAPGEVLVVAVKPAVNVGGATREAEPHEEELFLLYLILPDNGPGSRTGPC